MGIETQPDATLGAAVWGKGLDLRWGDDFVGNSQTQRPDTRFEGEAVFVGHGITAPEFKWDDFKGVDVTGKVLVMFTNEPPSTDPKFFDGRALTFYGRWVYKYEEALRRGAKACIIIHTTPTASYGWDVVRNSWGREAPFVKLEPGAKALSFQGWITREAGEKFLALAGKNLDDLLKASERADFKPIELGIQVRGHMPSKIRTLDTRNVAAMIPGSDPKLKDEYIIYSAHWDHLGIGTPVGGDAIYNGAIDNATGCAILLELARVWGALPQKPKRSVLFLSVTAEEGGLQRLGILRRASAGAGGEDRGGSELRRALPVGPRGQRGDHRRRAHQHLPAGAADRQAAGSRDRAGRAARSRALLPLGPFLRWRTPGFRRSASGTPPSSPASPRGSASRPTRSTTASITTSHRTSSRADWDFTALRQAAEYGLLLGKDIANQDKLPDWRPGDAFHR